MSLWSRLLNTFRSDRLSQEIDEELESHINEAIEQDRDPAEVRRAFGSMLRRREESRDIRLAAWLYSLRADVVFGWRQIRKKKVTSTAAILSLALAIGSCASAFRLIDAMLLRPLPVAHAERLYAFSYEGIGFDGNSRKGDSCEYPMFRRMRAALSDDAEMIAVSYAQRADLTFGSDLDMEKAYLQYVSGWMFGSFALKPSIGRLLSEADDLKPRAHPYAVLSYDYWTRRFGRDPKVSGRSFRIGNDVFTIVGVLAGRFTGTEPGTMTDIFVPMMMNAQASNSNAVWFRTLVRLNEGVAIEPVREKLHAVFRAYREERAREFRGMPKQTVDNYLNQSVLLEPATAGVSQMQKDYRRALSALGTLVGLVLLIACANVANLMTAQAGARSREMALRVSIGAGRLRLVQLVLIESAMLAAFAGVIGALFAWWSAPFVVSRINSPDNPARLFLPFDWRVLGFAVILTLGVTVLFGLAPALRASAIQPASALKGGSDPHFRRRLMDGLIAAQAAFCFLVLFAAGLFTATFDRLTNQPIGFDTDRLLAVDVVSDRDQPPPFWDQVVEHLRTVPGVGTVALARWALLSGHGSLTNVSIDGGPPSVDPVWFLNISPGWMEAMKIPFKTGRDFRPGDLFPRAAIVNEAFAARYFNGQNPLGRSFRADDGNTQLEIVGLVGNVRYSDIRDPWAPVIYVPFQALDAKGILRPRRSATLMVRTLTSNPLALASILRQEVPRARTEFRVSNIRTQEELVQAQTVRERLLVLLGIFFAAVAVMLAGVGLYGVLDYSVVQRRREIGVRIAIGAQSGHIARQVTVDVFLMVLVGAIGGIALGMASVQHIQTLLYQVKATDLAMLALPSLTIIVVALLAALPAVLRALRIDPVTMLRTE